MSGFIQTVPDLPDDVVLLVRNVSKKFLRNLRRSMWYGIQDLSKNLVGFRSNPETTDCRPQTVDFWDLRSCQYSVWYTFHRRRSLPKSPKSKVQSLTSASNDLWALRDVSFEVKRGEVLGVIRLGPSGLPPPVLRRT